MSLLKEVYLTNEEAQVISGIRDSNLEYIEELLDVEIYARGNILKIKGVDRNVESTIELLEDLKEIVKHKKIITKSDILKVLEKPSEPQKEKPILSEPIDKSSAILVDSKRKTIIPRSPAQKRYIDAIRKYDLVMGIGPAGTGKTYLAVASGIEMVKQGKFQKIVLTRPALEAGERLGFLPGDLEEKIRPYLQPIYDSIYDIMRYEEIRRWTERRILEIVPLAYMRGRTLSDSFIILDEAQNTTLEQMKMFLTRLGINSKAVITGDITQIDTPLSPHTSGLVEIQKVLYRISGIKFIYFTHRDVVRHSLVKKIINAYDRYEKKKKGSEVSYRKPPAKS
ncbi:MAG: PhoH family protein [Candidatus Omnitrophica bacterium]|nr:PhoH family protein [Candidatus Omnitrophota bacterium]